MTEPFLTTSQLAARWGIKPRTLKRWRTRKAGPAWIYYTGPLPWATERIRYPLPNILAYEATHSITPNP